MLHDTAARVDAVLAGVSKQVDQLTRTLRGVSSMHAASLDEVQRCVEAHVAKQVELVAQLAASGDHAAKANDDRLRASSKKMVDVLSGTMCDLVDGCASTKAVQVEEDERLYALLRTSGPETPAGPSTGASCPCAPSARRTCRAPTGSSSPARRPQSLDGVVCRLLRRVFVAQALLRRTQNRVDAR